MSGLISSRRSRHRHPPAQRRRVVLATLLAATLGACAASGGAGGPVADDGASGATELPAGAIRVGDDLYQVPIGRDDDGCRMFRMHSSSKMVPQAIFYRGADGGFTMNKDEAACTNAGSR